MLLGCYEAFSLLWFFFFFFPGIPSLQQGTITVGVITKMIPHIGLTITLPGGKTGKVSIFHLSDKYTENPLSDFKIGKVVRSVTFLLFLQVAGLKKRSLSAGSLFTDVRPVRFSLWLWSNTDFLGQMYFNLSFFYWKKLRFTNASAYCCFASVEEKAVTFLSVWLKQPCTFHVWMPILAAFLGCLLRENALLAKVLLGLREVSYPSSAVVLFGKSVVFTFVMYK